MAVFPIAEILVIDFLNDPSFRYPKYVREVTLLSCRLSNFLLIECASIVGFVTSGHQFGLSLYHNCKAEVYCLYYSCKHLDILVKINKQLQSGVSVEC